MIFEDAPWTLGTSTGQLWDENPLILGTSSNPGKHKVKISQSGGSGLGIGYEEDERRRVWKLFSLH